MKNNNQDDVNVLVDSINSANQMLQQHNAQAAALAQDAEDKWFNAWQADVARQWQHDQRLQTQEFNVAMWNLENEYNQAMWYKQNAYNAPSAQLKRAMDAGINPNSVINGLDGSNASAPATASPVRSSPTSGAQASHSGGLGSSLLTGDAQISSLLANARKANADADIAETQAEFDKASFDDRLKVLKGEGEKIFKDIEFQEFTKEQQLKTYEWFAAQSSADLKVKSAQVAEISNKIKLIQEQAKTETFKQLHIGAETVNVNADTGIKENEKLRGIYENSLNEQKVNLSRVLGFPTGTPLFEIHYSLAKQGKWGEFADAVIVADEKHRSTYGAVKNFGKHYSFDRDIPFTLGAAKEFISVLNPLLRLKK